MKTIKKFFQILIIPIYIVSHVLGIFNITTVGPIIHTGCFFIGMVLFLKRKIPFQNYVISILLIAFYVYLYTTNIFDPLAKQLGLHSKWWLYSLLYTMFIVIFGIHVLYKRRHDRYQVYRTISVMFFQVIFAFSIPFVMFLFQQKEYYFTYLWPLQIEYFYPTKIFAFPLPLILYSFLGSLVLFPILAILFGKRFYCSWVCGCGGLAETFGDRWRHLSDKSKSAWKFEKISIHSVLVLAITSTFLIIINWAIGKTNPEFSSFAFMLQKYYGIFISFALAGAAGVGFYPVLGTRVWCRFFCPMAAMLGLLQKIGRYHIHVKDNMCISCGNCSTFCEMGIDVRTYAEINESFTRASCVGCGICAHVCPRGVLKLENKKILFQKNSLEKKV